VSGEAVLLINATIASYVAQRECGFSDFFDFFFLVDDKLNNSYRYLVPVSASHGMVVHTYLQGGTGTGGWLAHSAPHGQPFSLESNRESEQSVDVVLY
jgi:hypothetical protein